jgi:Ca2+-transporting ATPase
MGGLTEEEALKRLSIYGENSLPSGTELSYFKIFIRQFLSPLIYILVVAAVISSFIGDIKDSFFIGIVLLINGIIGSIQEYSANEAALALQSVDELKAIVIRDGSEKEIESKYIVPGDYVLLEAGRRVPADILLVQTDALLCDESLLTGESMPVEKLANKIDLQIPTTENKVYAGSLIIRGRGLGEAIHTGRATEVGKIAEELIKPSLSQPPLMIRMAKFSNIIGLAVCGAIAVIFIIGWFQNIGIYDLLLMSIGLAVSAIPEGLPIAIAVALAISMKRMANHNVIVRKMPAVEALGSCTLIASDKTGTLTQNELTVIEIILPDGTRLVHNLKESQNIFEYQSNNAPGCREDILVANLIRSAALPNEAIIKDNNGKEVSIGDTVDIALLVAAKRIGIDYGSLRERMPILKRIPYEPELKYAASAHESEDGDKIHIFVKGAPETLLGLSTYMEVAGKTISIDKETIELQQKNLSKKGLRVIAFAEGVFSSDNPNEFNQNHIKDLVFLGMVGMEDPLRPEVTTAIQDCYKSGIEVAMITGDAPETAYSIANKAGINSRAEAVVTGDMIAAAEAIGEAELDKITDKARVFARIKPVQKLAIVMSFIRNGHYVAVTGDGINDAPALKHANVGIAMGKKGTDVAKESADIIISDDNFASIIKGILEGRVAYSNIRKVIFMLVSTGIAEVFLFMMCIPLGMPMPLLPVQLLWLNLVTNGIQDVALATEGPEGDELTLPPRKPNEPIFDQLMVQRIFYTAFIMTIGSFGLFYWLLTNGYELEYSRNLLLLLFVLYENLQTINARSERHSIFNLNIFSNLFLIISVIIAQAIHIIAMHVPMLNDVLNVSPVSINEWLIVLIIAMILPISVEAEKLFAGYKPKLYAIKDSHQTHKLSSTTSIYGIISYVSPFALVIFFVFLSILSLSALYPISNYPSNQYSIIDEGPIERTVIVYGHVEQRLDGIYDKDNFANQSQNKCYNTFSIIIAEQCLNPAFQLLKSIKDEEKSLFDEKTALVKFDSGLKVIAGQQKHRISKLSKKPRTSNFNDKIEARVKLYEDEIARLKHSIASRSSKISLLKVLYNGHISLEGMRTISSYVRLENNRLMFIENPFFALIPRRNIVWVELNSEEKMNCSSFSKNAVSIVNVNSSAVYEGVINNARVTNHTCILSINLKQMVNYKIGENVVLNVTNPQKYVSLRVSNKAFSKSEINAPDRVGSSQQRRNVVIIVRRWGLNIPKVVEIDATGDNYSEIVSGNVQFGDQVFSKN